MRSRYPFRKEAFGGLLYKPQREAHHLLNQSAFALLEYLENNQFCAPVPAPVQNSLAALEDMLVDDGPPMLRGHRVHDRPDILSAPTIVEIYPTLWCNERCEFCYVGDHVENARPGDALAPDRIHSLAADLAGAGVFNVTILGGEPFLYSSLDILVDELAGQRLDVSLSTNGTIENTDVLEVVASRGAKLNVALHGATADVHNRVTRSNSFEKVIRFLGTCAEKGTGTHVTTVLHPLNVASIERVVGLVAGLGVSSMTVSYPNRAAYAKRRGATIPFATYVAALQRATEAGQRDSVRVRGNCHYNFLLPESTGKFDITSPVAKLLYGDKAGRSRLEMMPNGDLYPASSLFGKPAFLVANMFEDDLLQAWARSPVLSAMRVQPLPAVCQECEYSPVCGGGIRGDRLAAGEWDAPPDDCPVIQLPDEP